MVAGKRKIREGITASRVYGLRSSDKREVKGRSEGNTIRDKMVAGYNGCVSTIVRGGYQGRVNTQ